LAIEAPEGAVARGSTLALAQASEEHPVHHWDAAAEHAPAD
jgi:hypothetical protein